MKRNVWLGFVFAGLLGTTSEAFAQQGYPTGSKPRCRSREVWEEPLRGPVAVQGFCRPKEKDGFRWVNDQHGGFFDPLVQRTDMVYTRGHAEGGRWVESGWIAHKNGFVWVEGHYKTDGSWSAGYWEKGRNNQEWVNGLWKDGRWQDGFWRDIPFDGYCATNQTYVESSVFNNLYAPEFCRENSRPGYSWVDSPYGGYWQPSKIGAGQVFIRGHVEGDFGSWTGESWESERPGFFFVQGRYNNSGKWIPGEWKEIRRGYTWTDGKWGADGSWTPGGWTYDPSRACGNGFTLEEEIKLSRLTVNRYCRENSRPGYTWNDSPYGGFWEPTKIGYGQVFIRGHIDAEFGNWVGESWESERPGFFFIQGHYDNTGRWVAGEWKEIRKGYRWQDGSWGSDGSWRPGEYIFDPASFCNTKETYVEEIKLPKLFVPRSCRVSSRPGYSWVNDPYGGYWQPNSIKANQIFVRGHVEAEFGAWVGERFELSKVGFAFEQGHYDAKGGWVAGDWKEIPPGYKWNPGRYNTDGSWVIGALAEDPTWTPTCYKNESIVSAIKLPKLSVPAFCRPNKRPSMVWVENNFGGWWNPVGKGYSTGAKVFVRGHYDVKQGWTGEAWLETQANKVFVQGHYGPRGEWVEGKWIDARPGYIFQEGHFNNDGSWVDGTWVEDKSGGKKGGGYGSGQGSGGGY